ncbi:MAG TPA: hypothetical protein VFS91_00905 [Nitrobacter sp.]|nr:hypothetical protein [Nitrobacter sp.]
MEVRAIKRFDYMVGDSKINVPRGLSSVNVPDDVAAKAIADGNAVSIDGKFSQDDARKQMAKDAKKSEDKKDKAEHAPVKGKH